MGLHRRPLLSLVFLSLVGSLCAAVPTAPADLAWLSRQVGAADLAGSVQADGDKFTIRGAGADIWRAADAFYYLYAPWTGDGQMVVRVVSVENTDPWAKAGVMFRENLTETSAHALLAMTPAQGTAFLRRYQSGNLTADDSQQAMRMVPGFRAAGFQQRGAGGVDQAVGSLLTSKPPRWLKLTRRGDVFTAWDSADGQTWEWVSTDRVPMKPSLYVGFAVSSHNNAKLCAAVIDQLQLGSPDALPAAGATSARPGTGKGLKGLYFNSRDHTGASLRRLDPAIDFDWGLGSPLDGLRSDEFTVRWEGELEAQYTEPHAFQVVSDDRARLWLNGELVIDEWYEHGEAKSTAVVNLEAGHRYVLRLDFFENRGQALVRLFWNSPSLPLQIVPQSQLYPDITDANHNGIPDLWEATEGLNPALPQDADKVDPKDNLSLRQRYQNRFATTLSSRKPKTDLPNAWLHQDVGRVGLEGQALLTNNQWRVSGSGMDIWANADAFHFVYQPMQGDAEVLARVVSQDPSDAWARAGVMVRETLEAEARHAMTAVTPSNGVLYLQRTQTADLTTLDKGGPNAGPTWVKLTRRGNVLASFRSSDGQTWEWLGTVSIDLPDLVYFGLVANSHDNSALGTVVFDQVALNRLAPGKPVTPAKSGQGTGLLATYADSRTGAKLIRVDPAIDFDWGDGAPAPQIGADYFTVRWEGWLEATSDERYALHMLTDDGARLWLDDQLIIDAWTEQAATLSTAKVPLKARQRYALKMEFYEKERAAMAKLLWSTPTSARQTIPQNQLYPLEVDGQTLTNGVVSGTTGKPNGALTGTNTTTGADSSTTPGINSSQSLPSGVTGVTVVQVLAGAAATNRLGQWQDDGSDIYAVDRRGALDYDLDVPFADIYRLEIEGASQESFDLDFGFYLMLWVDGEYLERTLLDAGPNVVGHAHALTPFLTPGHHHLRLFWDNAKKGRSLRLKRLLVQSLDSPDANGNGVKDWVEAKLALENAFDPVWTSGSGAVESFVSPACVEGPGRFLSMLSLRTLAVPSGSDTNAISAFHFPLSAFSSSSALPGAGNRWYADVPLAQDQDTLLQASFQNGGRLQTQTLRWKPLDLLAATFLTVRQGDALLLTVPSSVPNGNESAQISVAGALRFAGNTDSQFVQRFDQPGQYEIQAVRASSVAPQSHTIQVQVLSARFPAQPAAWVDKSRPLACPNLPGAAVIDADPRLQLREIDPPIAGGRQFLVTIDAPESRSVLARVGVKGPILAQVTVEGFRLYAGSETDLSILKYFQDGSQLIETTFVSTPLVPQVRLQVALIVGGVVFEDGTVIKDLSAADLQPLGQVSVRFIRSAGVTTSVCHRLKAFQADLELGTY